jgi:hypothetical protein
MNPLITNLNPAAVGTKRLLAQTFENMSEARLFLSARLAA